MPARNSISHNLDLDITVDGVYVDSWTALNIKAEVNKSRIVGITLLGREAIELARLGGILEIRVGEGNNIDVPLYFKGIIKSLEPQQNQVVLRAYDFITHLAGSQPIYFKAVVDRDSDVNIVGEDLYFTAANVANYKDITTSGLTQGSSIFGKKDMIGLFGHKTRKEFLDECFNLMVAYSTGADYPDFAYYKWYYAIRYGTQMDFFLPDYLSSASQPVVTLSEENDNIVSISANVNTTRLVNSVRIVSTEDETIFTDHEDTSSIVSYGVHSRIIWRAETNKGKLKQLAVDYVNQNRFPTISYAVSPVGMYWIDLGDLIKVHVPSLNVDALLPVVGYFTRITDKIETSMVLGSSPLTDKQSIDLIIDPQG